MSKNSPHDQLIRYRLNRAEEAYQDACSLPNPLRQFLVSTVGASHRCPLDYQISSPPNGDNLSAFSPCLSAMMPLTEETITNKISDNARQQTCNQTAKK